MSLNSNQKANKIKQALAEMRSNKNLFTEEAFSQIVMLLLDDLRQTQTMSYQNPASSDEMRLVTVMFVDVKDSTEIVQRFDPSDWKSIIDTTHEQITDVVDQWDGQVAQYLGDGVLCFFGARRSRGDDAQHAVACALQIQTMIGQYAETLRGLHGINFDLRIGISTGRLAVGLTGKETIKQERLAFGRETNLAARLQSIAPVGGVLIDSTTYHRIRRDYVTQAQEPVLLRGFDNAINNYFVLSRRTQAANQFTATHIADIELPLTGRDEDLALISYLCDTVVQKNRCHTITITGDVGIGKSRLLQEVINITDGTFTQIIMNSQYEARSQSQNLLLDMLATQCHINHDMPLDMIHSEIKAYITEMWSDEHDDKVVAAFAALAGFDIPAPDKAIEWVLRWFEAVASQEAIVITVDNLQWADQQSIFLLEQLAERLEDKACIIIAAGRPEYQTVHSNYMADYLYHADVKLEPLTPDATLSIIHAVFEHIERIPITLANTINARVEGNPLFVQEYLTMLFDNNVFVRQDDNTWRFNIIMLDTALKQLPDGLINVMQARLDELPDEARLIIQAASVSEQFFWTDSVQVLLEMTDIEAAVELLIMRGMIVREEDSLFEGETQYRFQHSIYREVAYRMIPRATRENYHQKLSWWLLEHVAGKIELYPLVAEQFIQAGAYLAALQSYLEAVEVKVKSEEEQDALELIDKGLGFANKISRDDALPVVIKLWSYRGAALVALERYEEASAASQSALRLLEELPPNQLVTNRIMAERILGLANLSLGRYNEAYDALTRAYNLLPPSATSQIASVLEALGKLYYYQGRLDDSYAYHKRAFDYATKTQEEALISSSYMHLGMIHLERGELTKALENYDEALKLYRSYDLFVKQAQVLFHIGIVHCVCMNYAVAHQYFSEAEQLGGLSDNQRSLLQIYQAFTLIVLGQDIQGKGLLFDALNHHVANIDVAHRIQLLAIHCLIQLEDYVQAQEKAITFLQSETVNPILRARVLCQVGKVMSYLGIEDETNNLRESIAAEAVYGGRDLWLHYATLADITENTNERENYHKKARELIESRATLLLEHEELHEAFVSHDTVKTILGYDEDNSLV